MPVKGTLLVMLYGDRVEAMTKGQVAYIRARDLLVTRGAIFLDILVPLVFEEDIDLNCNHEFIRITRIGDDLNQYAFELDTEVINKFVYILEGDNVYYEAMRHQQNYIIFTDVKTELDRPSKPEVSAQDTLKELEKQLELAEEEQEFEKASFLRDKIKNLKKPEL